MLRGVAQRVQKPNKVDSLSLKMSKIDIPPLDFKISNFHLDLDIKHLFWACWIEKNMYGGDHMVRWVGCPMGVPWRHQIGQIAGPDGGGLKK